MTRAAHDWAEHAGAVATAFPVPNDGYKGRPESKIDQAHYYLNSGFRDWIIEDANDRILPIADNPNMEQIANIVHAAEKPVRITLVIHPQGDGFAHVSKKRVTLARLKKHVWFYDDKDNRDEVTRNIRNGMPPDLVHMLYGINRTTAQDRCRVEGFKLEGVR